MRKMVLMVESTYSALNLLFAWFALANFYIFFVSLCFTQLLILIIDDGQVILTSSLEGSAFNIPHINVLNRIAQVRTSLVRFPLILLLSMDTSARSLLVSSSAWAIGRKGELG